MQEIERKFLIKEVPNNINRYEKQEILQWYYKNNNKNIRIRKTVSYKNGRKYSTYHMAYKQWSGLVRQESEKKISEQMFKDQQTLFSIYWIKKTRFFIPYKKHIIEVNQFHEDLHWLRMIEVEFSSTKNANDFEPLPRFWKEITNLKESTNYHLAIHWANKLIKKTKYEEIFTTLKLRDFYNLEAKKYSQTRKKHWPDAEKLLEEIKKYDKKTISILELGCWSWRFLEALQEIKNKKINYIGSDISENLLDEAKKISKQTNIKTTFICKDMINILKEHKQEEFDFIVAIASFQHLPSKKQRFLGTKYIYRTLKYNGIVMMTNRSLSKRMIKKYRKIILFSILHKIGSRNKKEWNDLLIPRKTKTKTHKRFYHIFTKKEIGTLFGQSWFVIKYLEYLNKNGSKTNNRKNGNNTLIIAKKTIYK